jgi:hypothetical protein
MATKKELEALEKNINKATGAKKTAPEKKETRGRKRNGVGLATEEYPPVNTQLSRESIDYLHVMARVTGQPLYLFLDNLIKDHKKRNAETFNTAQNFISKLK